MIVLNSNLCYNEVCYKETALLKGGKFSKYCH